MRKIVLVFTLNLVVLFNGTTFAKEAELCSPAIEKIDKIKVYKSKRALVLLSNEKEIAKYTVALGGSPVGKKQFEGDLKTPEGTYTLDWRNAKSSFHKSLHISYPNHVDREHAQKHKKSAGGNVFIHGIGKHGYIGKAHTLRDWTRGCIAVTNEEMDEIWTMVKEGTCIEIYP